MTPTEYAKTLVEKYHYQICNDCGLMDSDSTQTSAKQCALIAVDLVFDFMQMEDEKTETCYLANTHWPEYFTQVKQAINNLP